jgi:hypothetical protein
MLQDIGERKVNNVSTPRSSSSTIVFMIAAISTYNKQAYV